MAVRPGGGGQGGRRCPERAGDSLPWRLVPECPSPPPVLQEFSKEERDPVKTHEGWGVMLPCDPPAHYPGEPGP